MYILGTDFKKMLTSYKLYIAMVIGSILFLHPIFSNYQSWRTYSPMQLLSLPLGISDFSPFAVIFCVFPFADSFCEDYISGYYNSITLRVGGKRYAASRCLSVAVSGAIAMSFIMLSAILLCCIFAGQIETTDSIAFMTSKIWGNPNFALFGSGIMLYACRVLLFALFGALWALVGLLTSTIITNKYTTVILPFIAFQVSWFILDDSVLNPIYYLKANHPQMSSLIVVFMYQILMIIITGILAAIGIYKRVTI